MEIPYKKAKAEYFGIVDDYIGEMLKDSKEFKKLLCTNFALDRFDTKDRVVIKGFSPLDFGDRK